MAETDAVHASRCGSPKTAQQSSRPAAKVSLDEGPQDSPPLFVEECMDTRGHVRQRNEVPPPRDGAILSPASNLKASEGLKPLLHDEDEEETSQKVPAGEAAVSGSVQQPRCLETSQCLLPGARFRQ